ncbi:non-ribosomal peptide synthetase, partial [Pseudomonas sp. SWRI51]|uniref:condensation domain-containing protein n=1 Tax=Pseudomonas sp. SWRI51 TaxID=2745491 RepID=UPI00199D92B5
MDSTVAARIARRFITLPLDKRTLYLEKMQAEGVSPANLPIPEVQSAFEQLPLSYAQERQWFLWQLEPDSSAYHIPMALRLRGRLDRQALQGAFDHLLQRHQTLRTRFVFDQARPLQVIEPEARLLIAREHVGPLDEAGLHAKVAEETRRTFDLANGPLLRVRLLEMAADDQVLILTQHHIVSDGVSMQLMVAELIAVYADLSRGQPPALAPLPIQYADYALWQRHWMEAGERERQLAYWTERLGKQQPVLELPLDRSRPAQPSYRGARHNLSLPTALAQGLQALARTEGCTSFMVLLAAFHALLHRYSGQDDIRIGVPSANRNRVETEGLIGYFVNTQVIGAHVICEQPFIELLRQVRQHALDAQAYQELPFEQLVEALAPERTLGLNPLFQVMFNHQTAGRGAASGAKLGELQIEALDSATEVAQLDLTLETRESLQGLEASFIYATDLFDHATVERMAEHFTNLLQGIVAQPEQAVAELPLLGTAERERTLLTWNATAEQYPLDQSIQQLIEAQVLRTPEAPA